MSASPEDEVGELTREEIKLIRRARRARAAKHSSASVEWYTPGEYVEPARALMGGIDLDVASCEAANQIVKASRFFTKADNGLAQRWFGRVWMNPPYGKVGNESRQAIWTYRLITDYYAGAVTMGVALVNAETSTKWFQSLWEFPVCLTDHRIKYVGPDGEVANQPTHGSAFVGIGVSFEEMEAAYGQFGRVIPPAPRRTAVAVQGFLI